VYVHRKISIIRIYDGIIRVVQLNKLENALIFSENSEKIITVFTVVKRRK